MLLPSRSCWRRSGGGSRALLRQASVPQQCTHVTQFDSSSCSKPMKRCTDWRCKGRRNPHAQHSMPQDSIKRSAPLASSVPPASPSCFAWCGCCSSTCDRPVRCAPSNPAWLRLPPPADRLPLRQGLLPPGRALLLGLPCLVAGSRLCPGRQLGRHQAQVQGGRRWRRWERHAAARQGPAASGVPPPLPPLLPRPPRRLGSWGQQRRGAARRHGVAFTLDHQWHQTPLHQACTSPQRQGRPPSAAAHRRRRRRRRSARSAALLGCSRATREVNVRHWCGLQAAGSSSGGRMSCLCASRPVGRRPCHDPPSCCSTALFQGLPVPPEPTSLRPPRAAATGALRCFVVWDCDSKRRAARDRGGKPATVPHGAQRPAFLPPLPLHWRRWGGCCASATRLKPICCLSGPLICPVPSCVSQLPVHRVSGPESCSWDRSRIQWRHREPIAGAWGRVLRAAGSCACRRRRRRLDLSAGAAAECTRPDLPSHAAARPVRRHSRAAALSARQQALTASQGRQPKPHVRQAPPNLLPPPPCQLRRRRRCKQLPPWQPCCSCCLRTMQRCACWPRKPASGWRAASAA